MFRRLSLFAYMALALLLATPVLGLLASALQLNDLGRDTLSQLASTVLPEYALTSLLLCIGVALGVGSMGVVSACAVTLFDFKGRKTLEWALLLPLAMPAYVLAYAYTDFLQFSGPAQAAIRSATGLEGRVLPEIRSTWGAVLVLSLALYPYVYLLARAALLDRATHLMEAARLLGASLKRRIVSVALPLARPAVAAGIALALMETLADYGVASYFGVQSFSAGIYKAWLSLDNPQAAAKLALMLLLAVAALLAMEQKARSRMRFTSTNGTTQRGSEARPLMLTGKRAAVAWLLCAMPVLLGFVLPLVVMLWPLLTEKNTDPLPWARFAGWAFNSLSLALAASCITVTIALAFAFAQRSFKSRVINVATRIVGLGYAVPGAVVVVGLLLPVGAVQAALPQSQLGYWVTATVLGLLWAYSVRFCAVALQSVQAGYARVSFSLDESAQLLGTRPFTLWRQVHWPLLKRPVLAAGLLVFVDVMKELPATLVLRPFNTDTLAVMAYQLAKDERLHEASLPSLAIVLVGLGPVWLLSRALRSK